MGTIHNIEDARRAREARAAESTVWRLAIEAERDLAAYKRAASEDPDDFGVHVTPAAWAHDQAFPALLESDPGVCGPLKRDAAQALYTLAFMRAFGRVG